MRFFFGSSRVTLIKMNIEQRFKGEDRDVHHFLRFSSYAKQLAERNETRGQWHSQQYNKGRRVSRTNISSLFYQIQHRRSKRVHAQKNFRSKRLANQPVAKKLYVKSNNQYVTRTAATAMAGSARTNHNANASDGGR